ncbi:hypothetical protein AN958_05636 [Leucoagaricus sp. SymC.cos]|nr:hypothetical protein AN958_05636 [Leucoagaricus sp. SymC.cos]
MVTTGTFDIQTSIGCSNTLPFWYHETNDLARIKTVKQSEEDEDSSPTSFWRQTQTQGIATDRKVTWPGDGIRRTSKRR